MLNDWSLSHSEVWTTRRYTWWLNHNHTAWSLASESQATTLCSLRNSAPATMRHGATSRTACSELGRCNTWTTSLAVIDDNLTSSRLQTPWSRLRSHPDVYSIVPTSIGLASLCVLGCSGFCLQTKAKSWGGENILSPRYFLLRGRSPPSPPGVAATASHQPSCTSDVEYSDVFSRLWTLSSTGRSTTPSQRSSSRADIDSFITVEARLFVALGHKAH